MAEVIGVTSGDRSRKKHRIVTARTWPLGSLKAEVIEANISFCGRKMAAWITEAEAKLIEACRICFKEAS